MIWLASLVTLVAFELPVIVQTVPCVRFTVLVLAASVVITPRRVDACALNKVSPAEVGSSRVLLFATAVVLVRPISAAEPCTEKEALLAVIVPLLYCNVLG